MTRTFTLLAPAFALGMIGVSALADGTPQLHFDQTVYDFGRTSEVTTVSGAFTFKNTGDGVLKMQPPKPSCGCTSAGVKPDTLAPGATGEIPFTLNLGFSRGTLEKHITVRSNDPKTPEVSLTIKVNYTPLYELTPMTLAPHLAFGMDETNLFTTIARTDGKPLQIARAEGSAPWITADVPPEDQTNGPSARLRVTVHRDGSPRRFNESVRIFAAGQSNAPVSTLYLYGEILGEVTVNPPALYWSITDANKNATNTMHVAIRSASGQPVELKNLQSTIKGLNVKLVPQGDGTAYDLVAELAHVPDTTISGSVSFETSVTNQARVDLPVIVNVFKQ